MNGITASIVGESAPANRLIDLGRGVAGDGVACLENGLRLNELQGELAGAEWLLGEKFVDFVFGAGGSAGLTTSDQCAAIYCWGGLEATTGHGLLALSFRNHA